MADRILTWHIPTPGSPTPVFYADKNYEPKELRIYAERAPGAGDLLVDILDDGVSIMDDNSYQKLTFKAEDAYLEVGTPSATAFTVNESISGVTSGASAKVREFSLTKGRLTLYDVGTTAFTVGESLLGASSGATGVVNAYVRAIKSAANTTVAGQSRANLPKGKNSNDTAQDFKTGVQIGEGSWVSLSIPDFAGASNVTVQLEMGELW